MTSTKSQTQERCSTCECLLHVALEPLAPDLHLPSDGEGRCPSCELLDARPCRGCGVHRYRWEREDGVACDFCPTSIDVQEAA